MCLWFQFCVVCPLQLSSHEINCCLSSFVNWVLLSPIVDVVYAVIAGSAPESTQFDACKFDLKLSEV